MNYFLFVCLFEPKDRHKNKWGWENGILFLFELGKKQEDIQGRTVFLLGGENLLGLVQMRTEIN